MSCGGEDLKQFADRSGRNATYTSTDAVFNFIEAIGTWVDEFQLKLLHKTPFFKGGLDLKLQKFEHIFELS